MTRMTQAIDAGTAAAPTLTPRGDTILSAVFLPGGYGLLDSHVVIHPQGDGYAVHYLVHDDDAQKSYLHQGDYELTYAQAVAELTRRVELNVR